MLPLLQPPNPQENVDMMAEYLPLDRFKAIYVVDLCHSLCEQAKKKVAAKGWKNVHVMEADACGFRPPEGEATLVTFSYSLSSECLAVVLCAAFRRVAPGAGFPEQRATGSNQGEGHCCVSLGAQIGLCHKRTCLCGCN